MLNQMSNTPVQSSVPSSPSVKLWTPSFIAAVTFLLGFPAGIVIASINWMRMNLNNKAIIHLAAGAVGTFVFILVLVFIPGNTARGVALIVNLGILFYLQQSMRKDVDRFKAANRVENAGQVGGCLIGLGVLVLFLGMAFLLGVVLVLIGVPIPE